MTLLLLNTTLKISLIVLVALATTSALRKRSAAVRHFVLAVALACAAATPFVRIVAPHWQSASRMQVIDRPLAVFEEAAIPSAAGAAAPVRNSITAASLMRAVGIVWMTGAALAVLVLLVGLGRLSWLTRQARRVADGPWVDAAADIARAYGLRSTPVIFHSDATSLLGTWGVFRSKVLLPADALDWPSDRIRIVLAHELAHVRRGDWIVQMAAELLCAAYWFNPLVWLASRRLRLESEQACDDAVLTLGVEGSAYATELVDLARTFVSDRFVPAAAIARPSSLERRVRAMLNAKLNRDPITRSASIAAAFVLAVVTVLVAGFGVSAQSQFATVSGTVTDQKGLTIAGGTLTLTNAQNQSKYSIKSDANGHFEFVGLPPGNYTLLYEFVGFAYLKREGIVLAGQTFDSSAVLQVGSLQETITVTDEPPPQGPAPFTARVRTAGPRFNPCKDTPRGGCIAPPTKLKDVHPIYPAGAKPGSVQIAAVIGADGRVASLDVVGDIAGNRTEPVLADAAAEAVRQWEFTPTYLDGDPIEVRMTVNVSFVSQK